MEYILELNSKNYAISAENSMAARLKLCEELRLPYGATYNRIKVKAVKRESVSGTAARKSKRRELVLCQEFR